MDGWMDGFTQLERKQVEMEHTIHTLQSGQTTVQNKNNSPPTPCDSEGERGLSALWTEVKRLKANEEALKKKTSRLQEEVRKLKDELKTLTTEGPVEALCTLPQETTDQQAHTVPTNQQHHQVKSHKHKRPLPDLLHQTPLPDLQKATPH